MYLEWRAANLGNEPEAAGVVELMRRFYAEELDRPMSAAQAERTLRELAAERAPGTLYVAVDPPACPGRPGRAGAGRVAAGRLSADPVDGGEGRSGGGSAGGRLAGYALVIRYLSNEYGGYVAYLDEFYLLPECRGEGNGGRFLAGLAEVARSQGLTALWLEVDPENLPGRRLYERSGFTSSERILMRRPLTEPEKPVPDALDFGLKALFVGYNPSPRSAEVRHHFAGPSNRFWKLLHASGLTPRRLRPEEDRALLALGYGVTNLVDRPTRAAADLGRDELRAGAEALRRRVEMLRPRVVAHAGKEVYRVYAQTREAVSWGEQEREVVPGVADFVLPNPSGLNRMPLAEQTEYYRQLAEFLSRG